MYEYVTSHNANDNDTTCNGRSPVALCHGRTDTQTPAPSLTD